jgi:catechol-2,3-dioxygenase
VSASTGASASKTRQAFEKQRQIPSPVDTLDRDRAGGLCEEELVPHLDAIVIHCRQPAALAGFYAEVLGLPVAPADVAAIEAGTLGPDESVLLGSRDALHAWLTPVRALEPAPGRVHLDVRLDVAGDLDRLIALGATRQWEDPKGRWTVLADPEGNLFCAMYPAT